MGSLLKLSRKSFTEVSKYPGLEALKGIAAVYAEDRRANALVAQLSPNVLAAFKYATVTSVEVKRRFYRYSFILSDRRRRLTFENLSKLFMVFCYTTEEIPPDSDPNPDD